MEEKKIIYKGIVDKELNPFSTPSWSKEYSARNPEGSGREMQQTAIDNFQLVLDKGGRIADIKEPHREKYATFQAIRWGYAVKVDDRIVPTKGWDKISPKRVFRSSYTPKPIERSQSAISPIKTPAKEKVVYSIPAPNLNQTELVKTLKAFDLKTATRKYLNDNNLKEKSPTQIFKHFTFGNSIARAFHHESPSVQYLRWAEQININDVVATLGKIPSQKEYDAFLFKIADSLVKSWNTKTETGAVSKMNIGIGLKIMNLLMKHLTFTQYGDNDKLISYLHVPWDKFTLQPLSKIWNGNPRIDSAASQGFVKNMKQYLELHVFITGVVAQAAVDRIVYEFWTWDKEH